jgi:hypothetical protein
MPSRHSSQASGLIQLRARRSSSHRAAILVKNRPALGNGFQSRSRQAVHDRPVALNEEIFELSLPLFPHLTQLEDGSQDPDQGGDGKSV